jgi:hypothetical protein
MTMMNVFELEMRMKERQQQIEKRNASVWAAQLPMLEWLLGAAAIRSLIAIL